MLVTILNDCVTSKGKDRGGEGEGEGYLHGEKGKPQGEVDF